VRPDLGSFCRLDELGLGLPEGLDRLRVGLAEHRGHPQVGAEVLGGRESLVEVVVTLLLRAELPLFLGEPELADELDDGQAPDLG
jgi:hypothetical protein